MTAFEKHIFSIHSSAEFDEWCMRLFRYQAENNPVYKSFLTHLNVLPEQIKKPEKIPFLPVELFRTKKVITGDYPVEKKFYSSGTSNANASTHHVVSLKWYENSLLSGFKNFFGEVEDYAFFALLPSYLNRKNASLVYMFKTLMQASKSSYGGFYLDDYPRIMSDIDNARESGRKLFLIGVSFALLDLADLISPNLSDLIIMETGGMKGRRAELTREELHKILKKRFRNQVIYSEYGMTELLSQAYALESGVFKTPPWMRIYIGDPYDPCEMMPTGKTGVIKIIDLANIYSCAFISTQDMGRAHHNGFEVLGRLDNSDIRGCNLLI